MTKELCMVEIDKLADWMGDNPAQVMKLIILFAGEKAKRIDPDFMDYPEHIRLKLINSVVSICVQGIESVEKGAPCQQ